ncbi:triacylglycerol lipase protein [Rutstroemia sp. NJR-2017a BBW]|nr:triacylglycerol lipase protein [Rutstroemia sp. NJR-2017a BBW]
MLSNIVTLVALVASTVVAAPSPKPSLVVDLGYSKYQGTNLGNGVSQWLGIRYAAPPLGDLRFRAPRDPLGGGFNSNANPNLNGTSLIKAGDLDIVVVTFNYRVGPWGFLASKEVVENGDTNVGLKDQRFMLEWVQKHITKLSAYGGRDDGLFHASAAESQSFGVQFTVEESQYQYDSLVKRVGCAGKNDTLACLRAVDISVILKNNPNLPTPGGAGGTPNYMWSNVIDGDFTPDYTYKLYSEGKYVKLPAIYGDDTNEGTVFTPQNINTSAQMDDFLRNNWPKLTSSQLQQIHTYYPKGRAYPDSGAYWSAAALAYGEIRYNCPGIYLSSVHFRDVPTVGSWNYHWDVLSTANNASGFGVTHTAELASIWGYSSDPDKELIPTIQGRRRSGPR